MGTKLDMLAALATIVALSVPLRAEEQAPSPNIERLAKDPNFFI
jgi:hypothetical protein